MAFFDPYSVYNEEEGPVTIRLMHDPGAQIAQGGAPTAQLLQPPGMAPTRPSFRERFAAYATGQNPYTVYAQRDQQAQLLEMQKQRFKQAKVEKAWELAHNGTKITNPEFQDAYYNSIKPFFEEATESKNPVLFDIIKKTAHEDRQAVLEGTRFALEQMGIQSNPDLLKAIERDPRLRSEMFKFMSEYQDRKLRQDLIQEMEGLEPSESPPSPSISPGSTIPRPGPQTQPGASQGANLPDRNNNPGNIKLGPLTQQWVDKGLATVADKGQDGGNFLKFTNANVGFAAMGTLLSQPFYADKTVEEAMRAWSNGGYGADVSPGVEAGKKMKELDPRERQQLMIGMAKREGFSLGGRPVSQSVATGDAASQQALADINQKIAMAQRKAAVLRKGSGDPFFDKMHDNVMRYVDQLEKQAERITKRLEPTAVDSSVLAIKMAGVPANKADWTPKDAANVAAVEAQLEAQKALLKQEITLPGDVAKQAATGREATELQRLTPEENRQYGTPPGTTSADLRRQKGQLTQTIDLGTAERKEFTQLKDVASASEQLITLAKSDPEAVALIGTVFSNPEGTTTRLAQRIFGGKATPKQLKLLAKIADLKSTVLTARAGLAQTKSEIENLADLLPQAGDADLHQLIAKLEALHEGVVMRHENRRTDFGEGGYRIPSPLKPLSSPTTSGAATPEPSPALQEALDILKGRK